MTIPYVRQEGILGMSNKRIDYYESSGLDIDPFEVRKFTAVFGPNSVGHTNKDKFDINIKADVENSAGDAPFPDKSFSFTKGPNAPGGSDEKSFNWRPGNSMVAVADPTGVAEFRTLDSLKNLLWRRRFLYTRLILNQLERQQFISALRTLYLGSVSNGVVLTAFAEPEPIGLTESHVLLPLRKPGTAATPLPSALAAEIATIAQCADSVQDWFEKTGHTLRTATEVALPTSGVFAEAVLGTSNSAELIDLKRHIAWHEMPIPHQAPDILAIALGSRYQAPPDLDPTVTDPNLVTGQAPPAEPPGAALAGILAAIQNGAMFRDMSNAGLLTSTLSTLAETANAAAANSGRLSGEALEQTLQGALELANKVSDVAESLTENSLDSLTRMGGKATLRDIAPSIQEPPPLPNPGVPEQPEQQDEPKITNIAVDFRAFVQAEAWYFPFETGVSTIMNPISSIPMDLLATSLSFSGDEQASGGSRSRARAVIDLQVIEVDGRLEIREQSVRERFFGTSKVYFTLSLDDVNGRPEWIEAVDDTQPLIQLTHPVTDEALSITAQVENAQVVIRFRMNAQWYLPDHLLSSSVPNFDVNLGPVSLSTQQLVDAINMAAIPNCRAEIAVHVFIGDDGQLQFHLDGSHDRFPWFEVHVNETKVDSFNPLAVGATPNALFLGDPDRQLDSSARALPVLDSP